ncbi:ultrapetala [Asimina triloba]
MAMEVGGEKDGVLIFKDDDLNGISGLKRGVDFIEVMCGCTSQRYGDFVGRLKVFANGDLEVSCECTPGCEEGTQKGVVAYMHVSLGFSCLVYAHHSRWFEGLGCGCHATDSEDCIGVIISSMLPDVNQMNDQRMGLGSS